MTCMITCGIILLLLGGAFHYHYWFVNPRKKTRMWTRAFLIGAPSVIMMGFLIYYAMTKNLSNFPPRGTMTFGYCYIIGLWLCAWTCVPVFIHEQFAGQSSSEVMIEETKKAQKHFQNYGSAQQQQQAGYMTQSPQQQQYELQGGYQQQQQQQYAPHPGGAPGQPWEMNSGYGGQAGPSPRTYAAM